jgi:hypothetical protein
LNNILFIPFGLPILCLDMLADMYYFWLNNFRPADDLKQIIIPKEKSTVSHKSLRSIMKICTEYAEAKIKTVYVKQQVKSFSKMLNVNQNL